MNKWVMLYGGDLPPKTMDYWLGPNWGQAVRHPRGAIQARFAAHPWGSVVDAWTTARTGGADVYWNVSTWSPYQVVLMKTRINMQ